MATGKISNAIRCLTDECKGGILSIDDTVTKDGITKTVYDILIEKHPVAKSASEAYVVTEKYAKSLPYHASIFEKLNARYIRKAAMKT